MITQKDIDRVKKRVKIGQKINVDTLKGTDVESSSSRSFFARKGVVIGKYPRFVHVRLASGVCESILWIDLV